MNIILFIHEHSKHEGQRLKNCLSKKNRPAIETVRTFKALKARLKKYEQYHEPDIFIILTESEYRLNQMLPLIDLLQEKRLILVLPDDTESTIKTASLFFPRYFTHVSNSYRDLKDIIAKMIT